MIAEKVRLRRSRLQHLLACPAFEANESEPAMFGRLLHSIIATWSLDTSRSIDEVVDVALREPAGVSPDRFQEVRQLANDFATTHDLDRPAWIEHELQYETPFAVLTGTPDRVEFPAPDYAVIWDWKSQWSLSEGSDAFQGRMYGALLCLNVPAVKRVLLRFDPIRRSEASVIEWEMTRAELLHWWETFLLPAAQAVLTREDRTPQGGAACGFCAKAWTCAASVEPYRHAPRTAAEAHAIFEETVRLEEAAKLRRDVLRDWYNEHEPEVINGLEVGFLTPRDQVLQILDTPGAVRVLEEHGTTDAEGMLVLDQRRLIARAKRVLVASGVAELVDGAPSFRHRKAV